MILYKDYCIRNERFSVAGECDAKCGGGKQTRERTITQDVLYGGLACPERLVEFQSCNEQACPFTVCTAENIDSLPMDTKNLSDECRSILWNRAGCTEPLPQASALNTTIPKEAIIGEYNVLKSMSDALCIGSSSSCELNCTNELPMIKQTFDARLGGMYTMINPTATKFTDPQHPDYHLCDVKYTYSTTGTSGTNNGQAYADLEHTGDVPCAWNVYSLTPY
jgi:hypothetical protein